MFCFTIFSMRATESHHGPCLSVRVLIGMGAERCWAMVVESISFLKKYPCHWI